MSLNKDNILTIGSIVKLKNGNMAMIIGFVQITEDNAYDYLGVNYPGGVNINDKNYLYFNNEDIERIVHYGYSNDKDKQYKEGFINILNKMVS